MDASPRAANTGALPSVLTSGATSSMLGHDCRDGCIRIGAFDARVRFIRRPVCPVPLAEFESVLRDSDPSLVLQFQHWTAELGPAAAPFPVRPTHQGIRSWLHWPHHRS